MIRTKKILFFAISAFLVSCSGQTSDQSSTDEQIEESRYGGVFRMSISSYFKVIQHNEIQKLEDSQIYWQILEGLVKYNAKTLAIEPALASDWKVSEDGLNYTFTIRDNAYFHDNPCFPEGKGRLLTVEDVKYSFEQIYDPKPTNSAYTIFKNTIVGGNEFHSGKVDSIAGVSIDGQTIKIQLVEPSLAFIQKLASGYGYIVAKEAVEYKDYQLVGTGPFVYDPKNSNSELIKLAKNQNYYGVDEDGGKLPYLDSVVFAYYEDNDEEMELFWNGYLTFLSSVPITKISEVLEERIGDFESKPPKYILKSEPELTTVYLELNMETPILKNKKVRQALNFAINRQKLVEKILKNQAYEIGKFGITPPLPRIFDDYDFEGVEDVSYVYNPQRAKELLAEAGYPEGKNFPSLEMQFKAGSTDYLIASEIQSQLRSVLNINIDIEAIEFNELLENKAKGTADIFRTNWVGDYPSAGAFLANAYGKAVPTSKNEPSYLNSSRYKNAKFDELYEAGARSTDPVEANHFFSEAEKILMGDGVFIILWYSEDMVLQHASIRNFETNSIGYLDMKSAYFKTPLASEYAN